MKNKLYKPLFSLLLAVVFLFQASIAYAHVVVKPSEVGAAAYQTFTVGVPSEKESPTTSLRLVFPEGIENVTPNVKPGWTIEVKKGFLGMKGEILNTGERAPEIIKEIIWTGGEIPGGQRDEFLFSMQAPAKETMLKWKAYQKYKDGTEVAWDQDPSVSHDHGNEESKPYSETKVVNDLNTPIPTTVTGENHKDKNMDLPLLVSGIALVLAAAAFLRSNRRSSK